MKARLFLLAAFSFLPVCSGETVVPLIAGPAVLPAFSRHLLGDDREQASSIYSEHSGAVLLLIVRSESGEEIARATGFFIADGRIVTNEHVVRGGAVFVDLGAIKVPASVERIDEFNDLALLRCSGELAVNPLRISKGDAPSPGTTIYSISNPAGLERSMSTGVVSAIRELSGRKLLQITAPISPGSS
ncbi:MAG: serine protease, partial [Acidobacteria bacterium]